MNSGADHPLSVPPQVSSPLSSSQVPHRRYDTVVIGAGVVGSALAMHLAQRGQRVVVLDLDLGGTFSSSELNAGGVRATFAQPLNIAVSQVSIEYFAQHRDATGYRDCGYLWMYRPDRWEQALRARERQLQAGWESELWTPQELSARRPFIDKVDDLAGAIFAPRDGLINPNLLKQHFREVAIATGNAHFADRTWCRAIEAESGSAAHSQVRSGYRWRVRAERFSGPLDEEAKRARLERGMELLPFPAVAVTYEAEHVVNCAGPWARKIAQQMGAACPSVPVRRQVSVFDARDVELSSSGMMIDPSGVYFHPEATHVLAGFADHDQPVGENFEYEGMRFFEERIWPALYERSSGFEELRHLTGWAGLYEVSPDETAILGAVRAAQGARPETQRGLFELHSFSGHGVMHSYAAARGLAELMTQGRFVTLDLSPWSAERFETGRLLREDAVI